MAQLTTEELEAIRKNAEEASGYLLPAWEVSQAVETDIPKLLAEVEHLTGVIGTLRSKLELISEANEYASGYLAREAIEYANEELR